LLLSLQDFVKPFKDRGAPLFSVLTSGETFQEEKLFPTMFEAAAKSEKVSERIVVQIRDAVLSGRLKPGDRVASERN